MPTDAIVPDDPETLLENYQSAMYQLALNRRRGHRQTTAFFGREVRRFETAIGAVVDEATVRTDGGTSTGGSERFEAEVGDFYQDRSSPEMEWDYWEVEKRFICPDEGDKPYYKLRSHHPLGKFNRQKTVPDITLEAMHAVTGAEVEMAASEVTR